MRSLSRRTNRILAILSLLGILLTACGPTPSPTPAPTPEPLPPPRLLMHTPALGEELPLDAPIELTFDQPMDRTSVEAAISITPTAIGKFTWRDERTLIFTPDGRWERGRRYRVTVAATARNAEGTPMEEAAAFDFSTVGFLTVSAVQPTPGVTEVPPDTAVTVVFNRPVVPLTAIGEQAQLPDPVTFMPPVAGKGEWLNTSIYIFRPEEAFLPSTEYTARISAGLTDTTGGVLEKDYTWKFTTIRPAVRSYEPASDFSYLPPYGVITVTFNQPMDHASVQEHFSLMTAAKERVAGTFRWYGGEKPSSPEKMVFVPDRPLPRGTRFIATVGAGSQARGGGAGLSRAVAWQFSTVPEPGLRRSTPSDGQQDWPVYNNVSLLFASPMDTQVFTRYLSISPTVPLTSVHAYWYDYNTQVDLYFPKEPATAYEIVLDPAMPDLYGGMLGRTYRIRFTTGNLDPYAVFNVSGILASVSAYTHTVLYAGHLNVSRLDLALYTLGPEEFMRINGFGGWDYWYNYTPPSSNLIKRWSVEVSSPPNKAAQTRLALTDAEGNDLPPGLYYVELSAPEVQRHWPDRRPERFMFVRSRLHLVLKQSRDEVLIWATDLATGRPVPDLAIDLYPADGRPARSGSTDENGLYLATGLHMVNLWDPFFAMSGRPGDENFALTFNGWSDGISPWDFNLESEYWAAGYVGYLYTDRPIYRPGQTVYFKGIVRADDDARYTVPEDLRVGVRISDPQGKELFKKEVSLSDMGTFYDELKLDDEAALGTYSLEMEASAYNFYASTSFMVAEYRKPEFQIQVTTDRPAYLSGETINVTVEATYYFGGPVADAPVHWSVLSNDYTFSYRCPAGQSCPWYNFSDAEWGGYYYEETYGGYGQLLAEGDTRTDAGGRATFRVPADIAEKVQSQNFTLEASVTDLSGQQVSNRTAVVVHKGEFYVGLAPRGYLTEVGREKQIDLITVDWESEPVAGVPLTVIFMERRWYSVRERAADGNFYWNWAVEDLPVFTTTVTTGDDGRAVATFTPSKAGSYRVRAIGRDSRENEIRASTYFWVWGGEEYVPWRQESNNRIALVADKQEYQVGDTAEILVPSPYSGTVYALVTVERGHIMESEVRQFRGNSEVVRVPIGPEDVPNVFVSVLIVQGSEQAPDGLASFRMGLVKLPVSVAAKELSIRLTPDRDMAKGEHYGPRQKATYDILVTDSQGHPVEAELSLRLADLAVLALADEPGPTMLETFWRSRGIGVRTSTPLLVAMERYAREVRRGGGKGGGGGEEGAAGLVRTRFADTAFWAPAVRTDKNGRAQVSVELPDNLTTWRMQARGITADTWVGRSDVDVLSTLDLLLRPVLPRFFVVGDRAEIATIVHNNTADPLEVEVKLAVEGLTLEGSSTRTVQVPAGDQVRVDWPVTVQPVSQVKVRMTARGGGFSDAREDTLPVYRFSTPEVVATAGRLSAPGQRQETVVLPPVFDPTQGELVVQVDGSLTASTQDALKYLEHYPYECTEQTVSRFLPNVLTYQILKEMGLARPELEQRLSQLVGIALQRLYNYQHYDGGWGWWLKDESDPYLTAYVLQGMLEAHRAGFLVDQGVMRRGAAFLRDNLPSVGGLKDRWEANRLAYMLYVLAEYDTTFEQRGQGELSRAVALFEKRQLLGRYGKALLAAALGLLEEERERVNILLGELVGEAVLSATGAHWEEGEPDYWNMNTDIRTTAIVLWAMSRLDPQNELLPNAVRWLMAQRKEGHWESTQDTAWALLGLVAYMRASGEMEGDFSYTVSLNGRVLGSGEVSKENLAETRTLQVEIAQLLVDQANRLVIERHTPTEEQTGKGQLYYAAYLRYYLPADMIKALSRGIIVARQYSPADRPGTYITQAKVGDVIQVKLTIIVPNDLYYVVVEDPLPAGCEGVDMSLKTTSVVGQAPELRNLTAEEQDRWYRWYGWGWWWFSHTEMRDEKVVLFADYLPRGTYEYTYLMRASVPGEFLVIPSLAYQMYFPEVFGRSDGGKFTVTRE
ncbi:MAG: Ig-like domain-containing protein [Chloroflexia bacterium]